MVALLFSTLFTGVTIGVALSVLVFMVFMPEDKESRRDFGFPETRRRQR